MLAATSLYIYIYIHMHTSGRWLQYHYSFNSGLNCTKNYLQFSYFHVYIQALQFLREKGSVTPKVKVESQNVPAVQKWANSHLRMNFLTWVFSGHTDVSTMFRLICHSWVSWSQSLCCSLLFCSYSSLCCLHSVSTTLPISIPASAQRSGSLCVQLFSCISSHAVCCLW